MPEGHLVSTPPLCPPCSVTHGQAGVGVWCSLPMLGSCAHCQRAVSSATRHYDTLFRVLYVESL